MNMVTDLLVTFVAFRAYIMLSRLDNESTALFYARYFFLFIALATGVSGIAGHAFNYSLSLYWRLPGWIFSLVGIFCIERSAIHMLREYVSTRKHRWLLNVNTLLLIFFLALVILTSTGIVETSVYPFYFVGLQSVIGLVAIVMPIHIFIFARNGGQQANKMIAIGGAFIVLAAIIYGLKISLSVWFNHNDLGHLVMIVCIQFIFAGVRKAFLEKNSVVVLN